VPDAGVQLVLTPVQLSVATGWKVATAEHWFASLFLVMLAGQVIPGGVVSLTVNVVVQVALLSAASFTVTVIVVTPSSTKAPAAGICVMVREPAGVQLSEAVTPPRISGTTA
jgi:hypothetical protein